jgi:hypothetical protein
MAHRNKELEREFLDTVLADIGNVERFMRHNIPVIREDHRTIASDLLSEIGWKKRMDEVHTVIN